MLTSWEIAIGAVCVSGYALRASCALPRAPAASLGANTAAQLPVTMSAGGEPSVPSW